METPEIVKQILCLTSLGWGKKRIAEELGISSRTVKRYVNLKNWVPYQKVHRPKQLDGLTDWLEKTFLVHRGNAAVVQQELAREHQIHVGLRTVERAVKPFRQKILSEAIATVRFETPAGKQMQIDFGSMTIDIAGQPCVVHFFAAVLGFSRRQFVMPFLHERQNAWFQGIEAAFQHFGGIPQQILLDNPKVFVIKHNPITREVLFNERFKAFAAYWGFTPKACAPYRARTKGKDENTVKYIKRNAIAGRTFASFQELEEHLVLWMMNVSDTRIHGTTGERPIDRFQREEAAKLRPIDKPPFYQTRELKRIVQNDAHVEVDSNFYSVSWKLIKQQVVVHVIESELKIYHNHIEVASHLVCYGKRLYSTQPHHLEGIIKPRKVQVEEDEVIESLPAIKNGELARPLSEYDDFIGGSWGEHEL